MSVVAAIEPALLTVEPGGSATVTVRVRNLGSRVDKFELTVLGPLAPWAAVEPPALRLFPSTEGEATVTFRIETPAETVLATDTPPAATATPEVTPSPTPEVTPTPGPTPTFPLESDVTIEGHGAVNGYYRPETETARLDGGILIVALGFDNVRGMQCDLELNWDEDLPIGDHPFGDTVEGAFICLGDDIPTVFSSTGTLTLLERAPDEVTGTYDFMADDRQGFEIRLRGGFREVFISR